MCDYDRVRLQILREKRIEMQRLGFEDSDEEQEVITQRRRAKKRPLPESVTVRRSERNRYVEPVEGVIVSEMVEGDFGEQGMVVEGGIGEEEVVNDGGISKGGVVKDIRIDEGGMGDRGIVEGGMGDRGVGEGGLGDGGIGEGGMADGGMADGGIGEGGMAEGEERTRTGDKRNIYQCMLCVFSSSRPWNLRTRGRN